MKIISSIFIIFIININITNIHPVHISVVNIDYNETKKIYEISIKLFTDDFEKAIEQQYATNLNIGKTNEHKNCNSLINKYIKNNLNFKVKNKNLFKNSKLIKKNVKIKENVTWLYYSIQNFQGKKIQVKNTLLNDLYNDQKNLFIFTNKNTQKAFKFDKNKINFEFLIK